MEIQQFTDFEQISVEHAFTTVAHRNFIFVIEQALITLLASALTLSLKTH